MIAALLAVLRFMSAGPDEANDLAARLVGRPDLAPELVRRCASESRCCAADPARRPPPDKCARYGLHGTRHNPPGSAYYAAAARQLSPSTCPEHQRGQVERWGVRGIHGNAGTIGALVLGVCVPPEALDVPILSALATARRLIDLEARYGLTTAQERALAWRYGVTRARAMIGRGRPSDRR